MSSTKPQSLSLVKGPTTPPLVGLTIGQLVDEQAQKYGSRTAVIVPWTCARLSFLDLKRRSQDVARGLLQLGLRKGDHVAILSGDDNRFIELCFACARIGVVFVIMNKTYTAFECERAIKYTKPKTLFIADMLNYKDATPIIEHIRRNKDTLGLRDVILLRGETGTTHSLPTWEDFEARSRSLNPTVLTRAESLVNTHDIAILLFTSGTTGDPKAAMLTHHGLVNNSNHTGGRIGLGPQQVVCVSTPLFHVAGLSCGLLACLCHGSTAVFPSRDFDPNAVVDALVDHRCTILYGVPTMHSAVVGVLAKRHRDGNVNVKIDTVHTVLTGASLTPVSLVSELKTRLGVRDLVILYGMTETSPTSFMKLPSERDDRFLETVGKVMPHVTAKVVDKNHRIVPTGVRGELCVSGYLLQKGYFANPAKTAETMRMDEDGVVWLYTGDEAVLDKDGYCSITGRIKDIIIRGGENIYPGEIEERLVQHNAISQASVVGVKDEKYGETVAAFLELRPPHTKPTLDEIRRWVRLALAPHKAPSYVFWVGRGEVVEMFPLTGSGKVQKEVLRGLAERLKGGKAGAGAGARGVKL